MPGREDLLALDPLSPIGASPIADIDGTTDPLALEPLSPLSAGARPLDADGRSLEPQAKGMT